MRFPACLLLAAIFASPAHAEEPSCFPASVSQLEGNYITYASLDGHLYVELSLNGPESNRLRRLAGGLLPEAQDVDVCNGEPQRKNCATGSFTDNFSSSNSAAVCLKPNSFASSDRG